MTDISPIDFLSLTTCLSVCLPVCLSVPLPRSLPFPAVGNIGTVDVADMVQCTKDALARNPVLDPHRVGVVGGSHGGDLI